jgi:transcriptional regulator with XRE-family HTH domain
MPDMRGISVSLPPKSTAFLPDALLLDFGHPTGMELAAILRRIDQRKNELGLKDNALAKRAGKADMVRNLRRALKNGSRRGPSAATIAAIERALEVPQGWLLTGHGSPPPPPTGSDLDTLRAEERELERKLEGVRYSIQLIEQSHSHIAPERRTKNR